MKKFLLAAMVAATGTLAAQVDETADDQPRSMSQSPTMTFAGDRYRVGVGVDTEFDVIGEFMATLTEDPDSALIGEGWLGRKSAGGIKLNYHWLFSGESEMGANGPVYTDGRIAKLFVAADQNQHDDRKLTLGAGYERKDWFISLYGMRALTDERLVNRAVDLSDVLFRGELDGRGFTRIDLLERVTDLFEKPFDWGVGLRAGKYYDDRLLRLRGGFDYEKGDFGNSQMTASFSADRFFADTPHGLSLRTGWAIKRGDLVDDRNDLRASLVYSYSFGGNHRPARMFREQAVEVMPEARVEDRVIATEVTLADQATFGLDSAEIRPAAQATLQNLVSEIREGRLVGRIQVVGHTCDLGPAAYNQGLSDRRAEAVVEYFRSAGIGVDEITWEGRGEQEPRHPNDSEENRSRNRRVEIAFVTEQSRTEQVRVSPDGPITEMRQIEVPSEAPWIRRALRNPVQHKREVDTYRFETVTETVTEGTVVFDNQPPQVSDNSFSVDQDSSDNRLDVLANDSDPDGDELTIVEVSAPANGQAIISGSAVLYTPASDYFGQDQFSYTVDDGFGGQATAIVAITVDRANEAPLANDSEFIVDQDSSDNRFDVLANDSDPDGDALTITEVSAPANGQVEISGNAVLYTPVAGYFGTDQFTYTVDDGFGGQATATVAVVVDRANQAPVANDSAFTVDQDSSDNRLDVLANDSDPDGDALTITEVSAPANGQVVISGNAVLYTPVAGYFGTDQFTYTVDDGFGGQATATVAVVVDRANQAPVANDSTFTVDQDSSDNRLDVLANDSDPDGDALTITEVSAPANGQVVISGNAVLYTPVAGYFGTDQFTYTVDDGFGGQATATVAVVVDRANQAPVANDSTFTVDQDSSDNRFDVLANDSDPDGDALTITEVSAPANGQVVISGNAVLYTPVAGYFGTDQFTYTVDDGFGGQASAMVTVTVESTNRVPQASDISASTQRTLGVDISVLNSAIDPDGDPLEILEFSQPANGSVVQSGDLLRYQPDQLFFGDDVFTYTVGDGRGGEASAQVMVTVLFANQAPVAQPDAASGPPDVPIVVDVLANDSDPDGDPLEIIDVVRVTSAGAETTINGDGTISFVISATCSGFNLFRYTVRDPFGATATANVTVRRTAEESGTESATECFL